MAFAEEDLRREAPVPHVLGQDLSTLSVEELEQRIGDLRHEITRLQAAVTEKTRTLSAADALFIR